MNIKELAELLKQGKYEKFCDSCELVSPRVFVYFSKYLRENYDDIARNINGLLSANVSKKRFDRYRYLLTDEAEMEYLVKNNIDLYTLTDEEKKQACIIY